MINNSESIVDPILHKNIWKELLGTEGVENSDNFFALGGDSMKVLNLIGSINTSFQKELAFKDVFAHPTFIELQNFLNSSGSKLDQADEGNSDQGISTYPLTTGQKSLWFIDQFEGSTHYHIPWIIHLSGELDKEALFKSLHKLVQRHESLRTVVQEVEEQFVGVVQDAVSWKPVEMTLSPGEAVMDRIVPLVSEPFDLTRDILLRAYLLRVDDYDHTLLLNVHHFAIDGYSLRLLVSELTMCYEAHTSGKKPDLPEINMSYAEYALMEQDPAFKKKVNGKLDHLREKLVGCPPLELHGDWKRPAVQSIRGKTHHFCLDEDLWQSVRSVAAQADATPYVLLLAVYRLLLQRYSGQDDFAIGTPSMNRGSRELGQTVGYFVNNLIIRSSPSRHSSFRTYLQEVRQTVFEALDYQDVPFQMIVDSLVEDRDLSRSALFQVSFAMQHTSTSGRGIDKFGDLDVTKLEFPVTTSQYDLSLWVWEGEKEATAAITYCSDLFETATITRMEGHYLGLLRSVLEQLDAPLDELGMLGEEDHQLLSSFQGPDMNYPLNHTVIDGFRDQVMNYPEATAVFFEKECLSYRELDQRSNQLAHYLKRQGIMEGSLVAMCLERSLEMVIGILAIVKVGGAYVPIDPTYPEERIAYMLSDSDASMVLSLSADMLSIPVDYKGQVVPLDDISVALSDCPTSALSVSILPDSLAYVIYTSGSTGRPKGVMLEHRSLMNRLCWAQDHFNLGQTDRVLQKTTYCFDVSVWEFFWPLMAGATLVVASPDSHKEPVLLKREIDRYGITLLHFVPSMLEVFLGEVIPGELSSLRQVLCSGEALTAHQVTAFYEVFTSARLFNLYGPTEAAIDVTYWDIPPELGATSTVPIGRPIAHTDIYMLDAALQPVPVGAPGQLCIGGMGLARGYLNRPELTAEKFITHPFKSGERLYLSGDLGRWLPDGNIEYLGRLDQQVKVRGFRIELGEIENVIQLSGLVRQVVVSAEADNAGVRRLVGYVVIDGGFSRKSLTDHLLERLPEYMVPHLWVTLESIPLTSNGKVDRKALPSPAQLDHQHDHYKGPRSESEVILVSAFEEVLQAERVGIFDSFFHLGGDSLSAMRLVSHLRRRNGLELSVRNVFEYPTIDQLSGQLRAVASEQTGAKLGALTHPVLIPMSFSQERLWFIDQLEGSVHYHIPSVAHLTGTLHVDALARAFRELVNRHEVLRTTYFHQDDQNYQSIQSADDWSMGRLESANEDVDELVQQLVDRPFDLTRDFMLRADVVRISDNEHVLVLVLHHIAFDAWSEGILTRELAILYRDQALGQTTPLPLPAIQYADYAIWQRQYYSEAVLNSRLAYWEAQLSDAPNLALPTDFVRPGIPGDDGAVYTCTLTGSYLAGMSTLASDQSVTPFMLCLAVFKVLLHRYSGQEDIIVGTPISGRSYAETEELIGFFLNTIVLREQVSDAFKFVDFLASLKATTLAGYEHQDAPFEKLVDRLVTDRDLSRSPVFQVMFVMQDAWEMSLSTFEGLEFRRRKLKRIRPKFDLVFNLIEHEEGLVCRIEYRADLYREETVARMVTHYESLLKSVVRQPELPIGDLEMITREESELLNSFQGKKVAYPIDKTVVQLFIERVAKSASLTAVVFGDEQLSYEALDQRSNQLANFLLARGVRPESLVGLCLSRSVEMVIGILGIVKAGAAYVPIDPTYPQERKSYILSDSAVSVVLSLSEEVSMIPVDFEGVVIALDEVFNDPDAISVERPDVSISPDNLAYIIYTSGSTGKPKGVMLEHRSLVNRLCWTQDHFGLTSADRVLQKTNYCFDVSVWEFFWPLLTGATLVMAAPESHMNPIQLKAEIDEYEITLMHFVPSMLEVFLEEVAAGELMSLRKILCSGEALVSHQVTSFYKKFGRTAGLYNLYGPTEAAIDVTYWDVPQDFDTAASVPIGRPIANMDIHILDAELKQVPVGVTGQVCIGGVGLARGYWNRPVLTEEKFVIHPFDPGERLYLTGDLGHWQSDGTIIYQGRMDHQIKLRGYRIELGEIERVVQESGLVRQVVVTVLADDPKNPRLVGYIVPRDDYTREDMVDYLNERLPDYMVPQMWVTLEEIPLTSNGKVDRKGLPAPEKDLDRTYEPPSTDLESMLAKVWQEVLRIDQVSVLDHFFEIGGHSLVLFKLLGKLRNLGFTVDFRTIFNYPTIRKLSDHLLSQRVSSDTRNLSFHADSISGQKVSGSSGN